MAKFVVNLTWDDAPHLTVEQKAEYLDSIPPHERDAVIYGRPSLGAGSIYPVPESEIVIEPFKIPETWPRAAGMDVGWKKTAAGWGAYESKSDTWYLYSEYYRGYAEPSIHADAIRSRGKWMPIAVDCHADRHSEAGALSMLQMYTNLGLNITAANNGPGTLESSLLEVYQRLSTKRLRIFSTCFETLNELRLYRRDENGKIVKENDHLMDAMRYLVKSGPRIMEVPPPESIEDDPEYQFRIRKRQNKGNQGRSSICGY